METKTYTISFGANELVYQYEVKFRKWTFRIGIWALLQECRGKETPHKVAKIIVGSWKRCGKLDGLARSAISKLTMRQPVPVYATV